MSAIQSHKAFWGPIAELIERARLVSKGMGLSSEKTTDRLVRYYATQGVLDKADRLGRDAAYRELVSRALARGASVVTATHDIADAQTCDQVVLLAGRIVAQGTPRQVLTAEHLLDAFGIALQSVEHQSHRDLIITEQPHGHLHEHEHGHEHGHGHDHD